MLQPTTLSLTPLLSPARAGGSPMTTTSDFALALADLAGGIGATTPPVASAAPLIDITTVRPELAASGNALPADIAALVGEMPVTPIVMPVPTRETQTPAAQPNMPVAALIATAIADDVVAPIPIAFTMLPSVRPDPASAPEATITTSVAATRLTLSSALRDVLAPVATATLPVADATMVAGAKATPSAAVTPVAIPLETDETAGAPAPTADAATTPPVAAKPRGRRTPSATIEAATLPESRQSSAALSIDTTPAEAQSDMTDASPRKRKDAKPVVATDGVAVAPTTIAQPPVAIAPVASLTPTAPAAIEAVFVDSAASASFTPPAPIAPQPVADDTIAQVATPTPRVLSMPSASQSSDTTAVARPSASVTFNVGPTPTVSLVSHEQRASSVRPDATQPSSTANAEEATEQTPAVTAESMPRAVPSSALPQSMVAAAVLRPTTITQPVASPMSPRPVALAPIPGGATRRAGRPVEGFVVPSAFAERLVGVSETPVVQSAAPEPATIAARVDTQPAPLTTGLHLTPGASVAQPASAPRVADQPAPAIDSFVEAARPVARVDVPTVPLAATPTSPQRAEVLPAAQMFAQAMFSAPAAPVEDADTASDALPVSLLGTAGQAAATGPAPIAVAASAAADRNTLDMSRGEWMMSMIDKIETLRDESGAVGETRLSLSPDALGNVDVSVRRDDSGQYQVRISADTAQARTMLADAAPRLNDMAEARGLKLSHAGVETGTGTGANPGFADSSRREAQQSAPTARRPASATTDSGASGDPTNQDTRIA